MPIDNSTRFPKPLAADLRELSEGMAIVIDGDTAPKAIASGQYLFIKNHSTLATGGYHATAAIASGADITSSNVTPDADGIVNGAFSSLSEQIGTVNSKKVTQTLLGNSATNAYFATSPINDYDLIVVALADQTHAALHGSTIVPTSTYTQSSVDAAVGVTAYNNGRVYGYANYVNNNTSNAQVSSGYAVYLYGIRWN